MKVESRSNLLRDRMVDYVLALQDRITSRLEQLDGGSSFQEDRWERPGGGGGTARVIENGNLFEKGGVNVSVVHGELPDQVAHSMKIEGGEFFATGLSLVIHPRSPRIPTVHANFRYFEIDEQDRWFGGGIDLTPYVANESEATQFHRTLRDACEPGGPHAYQKFKKACDEYFWITHRKEARGVGGLFYDYLRGDNNEMERWFDFQKSIGDSFLPAYEPIVLANRDGEWTEREKEYQLLRRGRYAEFNLVYDRGTKFGLQTDGRTESILMSLPPETRWDYCADMESNDSERELMSWLREPREWVT